MRKLLVVLLIVALAGTALAQDFTFYNFKKKAGGGAATTNYCNDANAQLCLYMNGNGGNETDRSANGYTFTISAGDNVPTSTTVPTGYSGKSRDFELNDGELLSCTEANCPNLNINGVNAKISMVAWVKPESADNSVQQYIIGKYTAANGARSYLLRLIGTDTNKYSVVCVLSSDGTAITITTSTTTDYATGSWHHVACVSDDVTASVYVDGVLASTPSSFTGGIYDGTSDVFVGGASTTAGLFDGLIDEVAVFNRALSSTEISNIYTNGITGNKGGSD